MFCTECGQENPNDANACNKCGRSFHGAPPHSPNATAPIIVNVKLLRAGLFSNLLPGLGNKYEGTTVQMTEHILTIKDRKHVYQCLFRDITGLHTHTKSTSHPSIGITAQGYVPDLYFDTAQEATSVAEFIRRKMQHYIS